MKNASVIFLILVTLNATLHAQQPDTLLHKLDSLSQKADSAGKQQNNTHPAAYNETTQLNVPSYFILLGSDVKQAFTKPFHMQGRDWKWAGIGAGALGLLALVDKPVQQFALDLRNHNAGLRNVSQYVTEFGGTYEGYTLGALGLYGFAFNNHKMKTTTLLATQAYVVSGAVAGVVKFLTGRTRPSAYAANAVAHPTFKGPFAKSSDYAGSGATSSFPSGHTTLAFAVATVYALEYKSRPWVPVLVYSAATLVGISRITENKHWSTDVLAGAALGYLSGRLVVNNYHRFAQLKAPRQKKASFSFNLQYRYGQLVPGFVYTFK